MKRVWQTAGLLLTAALSVLIVACMSAPPPPPPMEPEKPMAADKPMAAPILDLGQPTKLGSFLVDSKGNSLYMFTKDTPNTSNCYGGCATAWPPLLVTGDVVTGTGLQPSLVSTTKRTDGTTQVTYAGWPLYYYVKDKAPGDTLGQGVGTVWYLLAADGSLIKTAP